MKSQGLTLTLTISLLLAVLLLGNDSQAQGRHGKGMNKGNCTGQSMGCANAGICNATGQGFVDANNDGVCDNKGTHQCNMRGKGGMGMGLGFVDVDKDGINDNSPLAKIALTPEQKAKIVALRQTASGPHFEELKSILTAEQLAQLNTLRAERQAQNQGNRPGKGKNGHGPKAK